MTYYTIAEEIALNGCNVECWQCRQLISIRSYTVGVGMAWQVCCVCGSRGRICGSKDDAVAAYEAGNIRWLGVARAEAHGSQLSVEWFDTWAFYLSPQEKEMIAKEVILSTEDYGFVYVMYDLANQEAKIGGTGRLPSDRWKEHPRGLIPIMAIATRDWRRTESLAHAQLSSRRTSREEYFKAPVPLAVQAVISAANFRGDGIFEVGFADHFDEVSLGGG